MHNKCVYYQIKTLLIEQTMNDFKKNFRASESYQKLNIPGSTKAVSKKLEKHCNIQDNLSHSIFSLKSCYDFF